MPIPKSSWYCILMISIQRGLRCECCSHDCSSFKREGSIDFLAQFHIVALLFSRKACSEKSSTKKMKFWFWSMLYLIEFDFPSVKLLEEEGKKTASASCCLLCCAARKNTLLGKKRLPPLLSALVVLHLDSLLRVYQKRTFFGENTKMAAFN